MQDGEVSHGEGSDGISASGMYLYPIRSCHPRTVIPTGSSPHPPKIEINITGSEQTSEYIVTGICEMGTPGDPDLILTPAHSHARKTRDYCREIVNDWV